MSSVEEQVARYLSFWRWFRETGLRSFRVRMLLGHYVLGAVLGWLLASPLDKIATAALIPFAAILVSLPFAWAGNVGALLQTTEMKKFAEEEDGEALRDWVFSYQLSILVLLIVVTMWALLAAGVLDRVPRSLVSWEPARLAGRGVVFGLSSLAMVECWQVVGAVQQKLLIIGMLHRESSATTTPATAKALPDGRRSPNVEEERTKTKQ